MTNLNAGGILALILCAVLLLPMVACGPLNVVSAAVNALEAAAQALPTTVLSAADKALAAGYYTSVNTALACVTAELATTDVGVVRDTAIGACLTTALASFPGLPPTVQVVAAAVNAALAAIKGWYSTKSTAKVDAGSLQKIEARRAAIKIH
jgi:hypothetical protein